MSTELRETFEGHVGGQKVVSVYRAFAEPDKPYCLTLDLGGQELAYLTIKPQEAIDGVSEEEAEDYNRRNAVRWVDLLTHLAEGYLAWKDFNADLDAIIDAESELFTAPAQLEARVPRTVRELTEAERDAEWTYNNHSGESFHYKWSADAHQWIGKYGNQPWTLVGEDGPILGHGGPSLVEVIK